MRSFPNRPVALLGGVEGKDSRVQDQLQFPLHHQDPHSDAVNPSYDALLRALTQPLGPTVAFLRSPPILVITGPSSG